MKRKLFPALILLVSPLLDAAEWNFDAKIPVAPVTHANVFQHLDATGRQSMAVSGNTLAVVWEDNRDGSPQAYVAFKASGNNEFTAAQKISSGQSAFGPTIVALRDDLFFIAWEQDSAIWMRWVSVSALGPSIKLSGSNSTQAALGTQDGKRVMVAWSQRSGKFSRIITQELKISDTNDVVLLGKPKPVDPKPPTDDQSSPALAVTPKGTLIAWEDRRNQHTVLLYSRVVPGGNFSEPRILNEVVQKSSQFGRGSGVTRVALAVHGKETIAATWMDKREFQTGYDIYAAFSKDGGWRFGANELVQDAFADQYAQWHPAIAGDAGGRLVVAWDDDRDDVSSIWLASKNHDGWSTNFSPAVASGEGDKTSPSIILDAQGNLHLIWLERDEGNNTSRILYAVGRMAGASPASPQQEK